MKQEDFQKYYESPHEISDQASVRFVIVPERDEEVIDQIRLGDKEFIDSLYQIGHNSKNSIFSYQHSKEKKVQLTSLIIHQQKDRTYRETIEEVRLEVEASGTIIIDKNITGQKDSSDSTHFVDMMMVATDTIEHVLFECFQFSSNLYDYIDKYKRHSRFYYNVAVIGMGFRTLVKEIKKQDSYSMNMNGFGNNEPFIVYDSPRVIAREDLYKSQSEISRVITLLSRKVEK